MWQIYVLGSLFTSATEHIIDKASFAKNVAVDFFAASFWRTFLFFAVTAIIGLLGWMGQVHLSFSWQLLAVAPIGVFSSLFYSYLLQKVELTSTTVVSYVAPIVFLFIDSTVLHTVYSTKIAVGVLLLVLGGIGFSLNAVTRRLKPELTKMVWLIFAFNILWTGIEAYLFKYLHVAQGINSVSFFSSLWLVISILLLAIVCFKGRFKKLFNKASFAYIRQSSFSKSCDAVSTVLWAQALTLAALSQVSAFEAFYPLILFLFVVIAQEILHLKLDERLDRHNFILKAFATVCLVVGAILAS